MEFEIEIPKEKSDLWSDHCPIVKSRDGRNIQVFLTDAIDAAGFYNELVFTLNNTVEGDVVKFHINNGGGDIDSAFFIRDALLNCKAKTIARLSGTVASASTVITLACDEVEVTPFLSFMSHNYSHGTHGSGNQVKGYVDFTDRELKRAFREVYTNFLTEDEIALVTEQDKEIWLNEIEVAERWAKYKKAKSQVSEAYVEVDSEV